VPTIPKTDLAQAGPFFFHPAPLCRRRFAHRKEPFSATHYERSCITMTHRIVGVLATLILLLGSYGRSVAAPSPQTLFPDGVTIVVGFGSGGTVDTGARILQSYLQKQLGVTVVVQNMPGAGGIPASHYVFTQKPNAPIFLMSFIPALTIAQVVRRGAYDMRKLTPIYGVYGHNTIVLIAKKGSPYKDYASLKNATKPITAAVAGIKSSISWAALAELAEINGINVVPVPYKGGEAGSDAALGGAVDISATTLVEATRLVSSGKAQAVLHFGDKPLPQLPGVQAIGQVGKTSEVFDTTLGLTGPPDMPKDTVDAIAGALAAIVKNPAFLQSVKNVGLEVEPQPPAAWGATLSKSFETINHDAPLLEKFTAQ
jgi:tripartite-type tricarboxylate transporter receptor subunit TctC